MAKMLELEFFSKRWPAVSHRPETGGKTCLDIGDLSRYERRSQSTIESPLEVISDTE